MKSNCEKDYATSLVKNFHSVMLTKDIGEDIDVKNKSKEKSTNTDSYEDCLIIHPEPPKLTAIETHQLSLVASEICNDLLKIINCEACENDIQSSNDSDDCSIMFPSDDFISNFIKLHLCMVDILPEVCTSQPLKKILISRVKTIILNTIGCTEHCKNLKSKFVDMVANHSISSFCKNINDLLENEPIPMSDNCRDSQIYRVASTFRKKGKNIGKYSQGFEDS